MPRRQSEAGLIFKQTQQTYITLERDALVDREGEDNVTTSLIGFNQCFQVLLLSDPNSLVGRQNCDSLRIIGFQNWKTLQL